MISADVALATLIDRTSEFFQNAPPAYMTYRERTSVSGANRTEQIDRTIAVRVADNFAVMQDLPNGAERTGQAFPIIAYFDPLSSFDFRWFANLKRVDITISTGAPWYFTIPTPDPNASMTVPYHSFFSPHYAPDSRDDALHILVDPTPRFGGGDFPYPAEIVEDPQTHLPSHIVIRASGDDSVIALDYSVIQGHWVITHGMYTQTQHVLAMTFKVTADITYDRFAFPASPPDPRLAGTPVPSPTPSAGPSP